MSVSLLASQCPAPVVESSYPLLATAENTAGTGVAVARHFAAGDTSTVPSKLNRNADNIDLLATFGGGGFAILSGLTLSAGAGLTLNIAAGLAAIGGYVEISAATTACEDNHSTATDRVWIWLTQAGAISRTLNTTPPTTRCVCLGSVTTSGGVITGVDTSGVMTLLGGKLWRETADIGQPLDSPSVSLRFLTKTLAGIFEWNGSAYKPYFQLMNPNQDTFASTEAVKILSGKQVWLFDKLTNAGTITCAGKLRVN